jgi:hypothetical protein
MYYKIIQYLRSIHKYKKMCSRSSSFHLSKQITKYKIIIMTLTQMKITLINSRIHSKLKVCKQRVCKHQRVKI